MFCAAQRPGEKGEGRREDTPGGGGRGWHGRRGGGGRDGEGVGGTGGGGGHLAEHDCVRVSRGDDAADDALDERDKQAAGEHRESENEVLAGVGWLDHVLRAAAHHADRLDECEDPQLAVPPKVGADPAESLGAAHPTLLILRVAGLPAAQLRQRGELAARETIRVARKPQRGVSRVGQAEGATAAVELVLYPRRGLEVGVVLAERVVELRHEPPEAGQPMQHRLRAERGGRGGWAQWDGAGGRAAPDRNLPNEDRSGGGGAPPTRPRSDAPTCPLPMRRRARCPCADA